MENAGALFSFLESRGCETFRSSKTSNNENEMEMLQTAEKQMSKFANENPAFGERWGFKLQLAREGERGLFYNIFFLIKAETRA